MLTTILARDITPGDTLAIAANGPSRIQVRDVATIGGRIHITEHVSGELIPPAYTLPADALVSRYSAR
jgi:hypothetical protein